MAKVGAMYIMPTVYAPSAMLPLEWRWHNHRTQKKAHLFPQNSLRSLCGMVTLPNRRSTIPLLPSGNPPGHNECLNCWRSTLQRLVQRGKNNG